jgi:hypothetical protein
MLAPDTELAAKGSFGCVGVGLPENKKVVDRISEAEKFGSRKCHFAT